MVQSRLNGKLCVEWTGGDPYPADFPYRRARHTEVRENLDRRQSFVA
jgi:hypothetical protein